MPNKTVLNLSILLVFAYWLYQLFLPIDQNLPDDFTVFVAKILISKSIQFVSIYALVRLMGAGWAQVGFSGTNLKKQILTGLVFGIVMFIVFNVLLTSLMRGIFPTPDSGSGSITKYFADISNIYLWMLIGIFGGGVVEELMRIFCLTVFRERFGTSGLYFALMVSSFTFGWGHLYQGLGSAITVGLSGLALGIFYIKRGSVLEVMIIHAMGDLLAIVAGFLLQGH